MFKLNEEQLKWKDVIENNDNILIFTDRDTGKTTAMRTVQNNVVIFVNSMHEAKQHQCDKGNIKTLCFGESPKGHHPDILIFDDVTVNKDNFEMFKQYLPMAKSKVIVIGTYHYWEVVKLFKEIGVVYEM